MARAPKAGDRYRYTGDTPLGIDAGALLPGTVVEVREVVDAAEPGAHDDLEDAVVVEWDTPGHVTADVRTVPYVDGTGRDRARAVPVLAAGTVRRAMSIGVDGRDYVDGDGTARHLPGFRDLFERED